MCSPSKYGMVGRDISRTKMPNACIFIVPTLPEKLQQQPQAERRDESR